MQKDYDLVIVGGGMVGAALASALKDTELSIAIIEKSLPVAFSPQQDHDLRVSALSHSSESFLDELGAWQQILSWRACPYKRMKVWELSETYASTLFDSDDINADHLGYIVENRLIQRALLNSFDQANNISLYNLGIERITYSPGASVILLDDGTSLATPLLVGADGATSSVRSAANIGVHRWDYEQGAMIINVDTDFVQQDITWQQFTPQGPRALLPLTGQHASLVWYDSPQRLNQLMELDDEALLKAIKQNFPDALGELTGITAKGWFPLARQHAQAYCKEGVVLIGDSAHTINPLAGQGVNIGLLDARALALQIKSSLANGKDYYCAAELGLYENARRQHNRMMMQAMDGFYRAFSNANPIMKLIRNSALSVAGNIPFARQWAIRLAMGEQLKPSVPFARREEV